MKTIAISRLIGSDAGKVAQRVSEKLEYAVIDRAILEGIFRQYGLTKFGELYTTPPNIWDLANSKNLEIVSMIDETMDALAHRGRTLILGRGGYAALEKYADVLNVRLQAPFSVRVDRLMARENLTHRWRTERLIKADDKARQQFLAKFYNEGWDVASNFDLVIDTNAVPVEMAADWIIEATRALSQKQFGADEVTAERIKVNPTLLDAIEIALARRLPVQERLVPEAEESESSPKPVT